MSNAVVLYRIYDLPWTSGSEEQSRFRRITRSTLATLLVLALIHGVYIVLEMKHYNPHP